MADTFSAELTARLGWAWKAATGNPKDVDELEYNKLLTNGVGSNQAEAKWSIEGETILSGSDTTYDLTALVRTIFGDSLTLDFYWIKALMIQVTSTSGGDLVVGAAATNAWSGPLGTDSDTIAIPPDSVLLLTNRGVGWAVDDANKNSDDGSGSGSAP